jgi:hypothetical protein
MGHCFPRGKQTNTSKYTFMRFYKDLDHTLILSNCLLIAGRGGKMWVANAGAKLVENSV